MHEPTNLHKRIREYRTKAGFTQQQLADKIGVKLNTVAIYESGRSLPSIAVLMKVSQALNVSVDTLLGNSPFEHGISDDALIALLKEARIGLVEDNEELFLTLPLMYLGSPYNIGVDKKITVGVSGEHLRDKVVEILSYGAQSMVVDILKHQASLRTDEEKAQAAELSDDARRVVEYANQRRDEEEKERAATAHAEFEAQWQAVLANDTMNDNQ